MKKILSLVLALMLVLSVIPMTALAADVPHKHKFEYVVNRVGHGYICSCGEKKDFKYHVKPEDAKDGKCVCGYTFSDNTDLSVLWLADMTLSPKFEKGTTEYEGKLYTYKDVTKTKITAKSFDAKATVELPEDLDIKKGTNKFEIKVTAEDKKTTKTYTVTVVKD